MKKLTLALLIAAALNVPTAEGVFIPLSGLHTGVPYIFRINDAGGGTAVMVQAVVRGRLELEETPTLPAGNTFDLVFTIPSRTSRVILVLDLVTFQNQQVSVTVLDLDQNIIVPARTYTDSTDHPHIEIVYEVAP